MNAFEKSVRRNTGTKGRQHGSIYTDLIVRVACLMADFPEIKELDLNPVRILSEGTTVLALDARARIEHNSRTTIEQQANLLTV